MDTETKLELNPSVPKYKLDVAKAVLKIREKELLDLKGACSTEYCRLHHAHSGSCVLVLPGVNDDD